MLGQYGDGGDVLDFIFNIVIFFSNWEIQKIGNEVKYNQ